MLALTKNALSGGESATKMIQILGMQWVRNNKCFSDLDSVQLNVNVDWGLSSFVLCWLLYDTNWFGILEQLPRKAFSGFVCEGQWIREIPTEGKSLYCVRRNHQSLLLGLVQILIEK